MKRLLIFLIVFVFSFQAAMAQQVKRYSFTHYTVKDGLGSYELVSSAQDDQGYIWISTTIGLQRFDGSRYKTFRHQKDDTTSIPGNFVTELLLDKKKNLWIQTSNRGLGIFNTRSFKFKEAVVKPANPAHAKETKGLVMDEYGNVLLLIAKKELLIYNEKKNEFLPAADFISFPPGWQITSLYQIPGTQKYIFGSLQGTGMYDRATKKMSYPGHNDGNEKVIDFMGNLLAANNFILDKKGRLWCTDWQGVALIHCFDLIKNEIYFSRLDLLDIIRGYYEIERLLVQKDGTVWIYGSGLLAQFNEKDKKFQNVYNGFENGQGISFSKAKHLLEDQENNLWVCTNNNGLFVFNPAEQYFINIPHMHRAFNKPGEGSNMSFITATDGSILTGTWGDGLYRYSKDFEVLPLNIKGYSETGTPSIWSLSYSKDSNIIWAGAQPGIHKIDQRNKKVEIYEPAILKGSTVRQVVEDHAGNLWIGTQSLGLYKWTASEGRQKFEDGLRFFDQLNKMQVLKLLVDKRGWVWVVVNGGGVYVIDPASNKVLKHFGMKEAPERALLSDAAAAVLEYNDTSMIIGADGIHIYNVNQDKIIVSMPLPESIPGYIAAIERDSTGYLWVSMSSGIYRVSLRKRIFIHFDRVDGIANDYFILSASTVLPDGRIVFGSDNQFTAFDPRSVMINDKAPDVHITDFVLMNKSLNVDSLMRLNRIDLSPEDNSITLKFSGLSYNNAYIILYKLEGRDKEWRVAEHKNFEAVYSYLPPGEYTFLVKSQDAEGRAGKNITQLKIKVKPPFWRTWWFLGLVLFAALGVLIWLDKLRMQKLRATESIRTRIATSLTEDMSNSLSNINISSELAKTKIDYDTERTKEYIGQISDTSNRMVQAMYDMVWSIDPKNDTIADTIERMKMFANETESTFPITVDFDIDPKVKDLKLDMEYRYELLCIYKEAVNNAAKHSGGKYVKVSIRYNNSRLLMIVMDDGRGFVMNDATMLARGVNDMRRRASLINASFYIESEINTGTIVKLEIPV